MAAEKRGLFFVVFSLFLIALFASFVRAEAGCYLYPGGDEDLYCNSVERVEAEADCDNFADCNPDQHFIPADDCSQRSECQEIICDVDCQSHALGWCEQLGINENGPAGQEVLAENFNDFCGIGGCCRVQGTSFCQRVPREWDCRRSAQIAGVSNPIFIPNVGSNTQCQQLYCGIALAAASITGIVKDQNNVAIPGAEVVLEGRNLQTFSSPATGQYSFANLDPGIYQIRATASNFNPLIVTVSLGPGETATQDLVLRAVTAMGSVSGVVVDNNNNPIDRATVSWRAGEQTTTGSDGRYTLSLPPGVYSLTASKAGYSAGSQQATVISGQQTSGINFVLNPITFQGIRGTAYIDSNFNGQRDPSDQAVPGARLYVDGVFRGNSRYSSENIAAGSFEISLSAGQHRLFASYLDIVPGISYETSASVAISIAAGSSTLQDVFLVPLQDDCVSQESYNIQEFVLSPVPGKKEVRLEWIKPCSSVFGYQIAKAENTQPLMPWRQLPLTQHQLLDAEVEWGNTYTYEIVALDGQGNPSPAPKRQQIIMGDPACERRYHETTGWELFCLSENQFTPVSERKIIYTCDDNNQLINNNDCADSFGPSFFCARETEVTAACKDAGICSLDEASPFNLYGTAQSCYGASSPTPVIEDVVNFCYFDSSLKTIVNECRSCEQIKSCFDYNSKEACLLNSCLGTTCSWVNSAQFAAGNPLIDYSGFPFNAINIPSPEAIVTRETGTGYCVEDNYQSDDKCSLCSSFGGIYENYYCTAEVCTSLGRCLSNPLSEGGPLSSCLSCGNAPSAAINCESYTTQLECTGGRPTENVNGVITLSKDSCNWGRCYWDGGSCIKDGDANQVNDCRNQRGDCLLDVSPPTTKVLPEGFNIISYRTPEIIFEGSDDKMLSAVEYCLNPISAQGAADCNNFAENKILYPGRRTTEQLKVDLLSSSVLAGELINGQTYKLRYYSKDRFNNQENVHEIVVYVDNVLPQFNIRGEETTAGGVTDLTISLENLNEPMSCSIILSPILPRQLPQMRVMGRDVQDKRVIFNDLDAIRADVNATCIDDNGNSRSKLQSFVFDVAEDIDIIYPPLKGAVAETRIAFKVQTSRPAICGLYNVNNQKMADFITDENGREHQTSAISGFIEKEYVAEQQVVCSDLLTGIPFESPDYFQFWVDFTPPETQVVLTEGRREVRPLGNNWEEFFVRSVNVDFECGAIGFACDKTFYCLGDGCEDITHPEFKEYESSIIIGDKTEICYYSTDVAGNRVYNPLCGKIRVEGYGITLENPEQRYHQNEIWGVSNNQTFNWQFFTRVPTTECRFDFTPNFNYDVLPPYKIKLPNAQGKYVMEDFPTSAFTKYPSSGGVKSVYVKCKDGQGVIGPEQKINLEYDPTAPTITDAYADPNPVLEGITVDLFVETDDKTTCRYSDNSQGDGSSEYGTMEFSFPGVEEGIMGVEHLDVFNINFLGASKTYVLNAQCKNGAGDNSSVAALTFKVDYSVVGNILSIFPDGQSFAARDVVLQVETSKNAFCEYKFNDTFLSFDGANTRAHQKRLAGLSEGEYIIPVRCFIADHLAENEITFDIDLTLPKITKVDDGNYTCGNDINVLVYSNETKIGNYSYEVFDKGIAGGLAQSAAGASAVFSGRSGPNLPIIIPSSNLSENHKYSVKVLATDAAGNRGSVPMESDGVIVVKRDNPICKNITTGPKIEVFVDDNSSCSSITAELHCADNAGCSKIRYGTDQTSTSCNETQSYSGSKIILKRTEWLCYYVENAVGSNYSSRQLVQFEDEDGDGIQDSCDKCRKTSPGKVADENGCSSGQITETKKDRDADNDGLPDAWELTFNAPNCLLDSLSSDTNGNGLTDNIEDYDDDGSTNYQEYVAETNPCKSDKARPEEPTVPPFTPAIEKNTFAWTLFIVGLVLIFSGAGYLAYYYYRFMARKKSLIKPAAPLTAAISEAASAVADVWKQRISPFQRTRIEKIKQRQRQEVFGAFDKRSMEIPHVENVLAKNAPLLPKLQTIAEKYAQHKDEIKPGLKEGEKSIFSRLEDIAKQTKNKAIHEVVGKDEAKDIFAKLKEISKKRKR